MHIKNTLLVMLLSLSATIIAEPKVPIVYHPAYNIKIMPGQSMLHPFDSEKYGKVFQKITEAFNIHPEQCHKPKIISEEDLKTVHTPEYLDSLKKSETIANIVGISLLKSIPNAVLQSKMLKPMQFATGGTKLATELALKNKWAINLSGGYHHAKANNGEGFCVYADIPLAAYAILKNHPDTVKKIMIVDLDAHQGNGFESIFKNDPCIAMFDMYNKDRYPKDAEAKQFITYNHPVSNGCTTEQYLSILHTELPKAIATSKPDLIIYNAGTDILAGDHVGGMAVSAQGVINRDEFVFKQAIDNKIPITMILSGGYTDKSAGLISDSIINLKEKFFKDEIEAIAKPCRYPHVSKKILIG